MYSDVSDDWDLLCFEFHCSHIITLFPCCDLKAKMNLLTNVLDIFFFSLTLLLTKTCYCTHLISIMAKFSR